MSLAALFVVGYVVWTIVLVTMSAQELPVLLRWPLVVTAIATLLGWLALVTVAYQKAMQRPSATVMRSAPIFISIAGGIVALLAVAIAVLGGHTFSVPIAGLQLVWNVALGVLGTLVLSGRHHEVTR